MKSTNQNIKSISNKISKYFHHPSVVLWRSLELEAIVENLSKINKVHPMLDLGCGEGKIAEIIFGKKHIDVGMDPEPEMVTQAIKNSIYKKVVPGDARDMPFKSNSFNFIFSNSVIEHIDGIDSVIKEASRILISGGSFMFTVPNEKLRRNLFFTRLFRQVGLVGAGKWYSRSINSQLDHYNLLSEKQWRKLLDKNKLKISYIAYYLDKRQTALWDIFRVLFLIFKPIQKNYWVEKIQDKVTTYLLKEIVNWECNEDEGSCTIIIAKKV